MLFFHQAVVRVSEKTSRLPDPLVPLDTKERLRKSKGLRGSKSGNRTNGAVKGRRNLENQPSGSHLNGPSCNENNIAKLEHGLDGTGSRDIRATSSDRFSDASRHSNSSRGYLVSQHSLAAC